MAYTVTIGDGSITKLQEDRYFVAYNLLVEDDSPAATLYDSSVGVSWDGDNDWTDLRLRIGLKMQDIVDKVIDERTKFKSSVYTNIKTWLQANVTGS